jgi:RNA polymerase sigma-54 factor
MAIKLNQSLKLGQNLVMTPQLQQAIKLLQLNHLELADMITQELTDNPILEEVSDEGSGDGMEGAAGEDTYDPEVQQQNDEQSQIQAPTEDEKNLGTKEDDVNWDAYLEEFNDGPSTTTASMKEIPEGDMPSYENLLTKSTSLEEHLLWQLGMHHFTEQETRFGQLVISALNDDGYFEGNLSEIAQACDIEYEDAEEVLKMIQNFDPIGIASRDLQECLMIQAKLLNPRSTLVESIIQSCMNELEKHNLPAIAKMLDVPIEQVVEAQKIIHEFEPKPGKIFTESDTQYIAPDIYVIKVANEFVIQMNDEGIPRLRISNYYKNIVKKEMALKSGVVASEDGGAHHQAKEYVHEKLRAAMWLIKSIQNRQKTIHKVTEAILARQREFFEKGAQFLKPMVLKDIAADVGMHESTISRVTTNKYMHTPVGTFELKYFFNSSINSSDGGDSLASSAVKEKIKQLIAKEDLRKPFSDQQIVEILQKDNIDIARRTVAKYREMLNILPSSRRKRAF